MTNDSSIDKSNNFSVKMQYAMSKYSIKKITDNYDAENINISNEFFNEKYINDVQEITEINKIKNDQKIEK